MKTLVFILLLSISNLIADVFGGMQESFVKLNNNDLNIIINSGEKSVKAQIAAAEALKAERIKAEKERLKKEVEARKQAKIEAERAARAKKIEEERVAREKVEVEKQRLEQERIAKEQAEQERIAQEKVRRLEAEKRAEVERLEQERIAKEQAERITKQAEVERLAREKEKKSKIKNEKLKLAEQNDVLKQDNIKRPLIAYLDDKSVKNINSEKQGKYLEGDIEQKVASNNVVKEPLEAAKLTKTLPFLAKITSDKATLRLCAAKECQIVAHAKTGDEFVFVASEGERYQTESGRWIHKDFIEPISNLNYEDLTTKFERPANVQTKKGFTLPFLGVLNSSKATIRNCPEQSCNITDRPKKGNYYVFIAQSGDRLQTTNGEWIHEDFIDFKKSLSFAAANNAAKSEEANTIIIVDSEDNVVEMRKGKNGENIALPAKSDATTVKEYSNLNIQDTNTTKNKIVLDKTLQGFVDDELKRREEEKQKENEQLQQKIINYAQTAGGIANSDDPKTAIVNLAQGYAKSFVKDGVQQYLSEFHSGINLDLGIDYDISQKKWSGNTKILVPYTTKDFKRTYFVQSGVGLYPNNRWIAHTGVGLRVYPNATSVTDTGELMVGINYVYDYDLSRTHRRHSVGGEFMYDTLLLTGNIYGRLTDWIDSYDFDGDWVEERPANGWDLNVKYALPNYKQLALTGGLEHWQGDKVSVFGNTDKDSLEKDPYVYKLGIEYQPIPMITFSLDHSRTSKSEKSTTIKMNFTIPLGDRDAWRKATNPRYAGLSNTVEASRNSFIKRNYSMPLEYRSKPGKYHITYCGLVGVDTHCFRITDGFDDPAIGVNVRIMPSNPCVKLNNSGSYVSNRDGKVFATIIESCTTKTTLHVEAGESSGDFDIKIAKLSYKLVASPEELERHETSTLTLEGTKEGAGLEVVWEIDGKGALQDAQNVLDENGNATVKFVPDPTSVNGETITIRAKIGDNVFEKTITILVYGLGSTLNVTPTQIGYTEYSVATLDGLRPGTEVTFTLTTSLDSATLMEKKGE